MPGRSSSSGWGSRSCGAPSSRSAAVRSAGRTHMDGKQQDPRQIDQDEDGIVAGVVMKPGGSFVIRRRGSLSARLVIGLAIMGIGILLFLGSLGVVDIHFRDVVRCWPAILIAVGLVKVFSPGGAAARIFGAVIATFGTLLLLDRFNYLDFDWKLMGP